MTKKRGTQCLNCGRPLDSQFCPDCGQENTDSNVSLPDLARDILDEFLKFDAKLWATLKPLFWKPGFLTQEYLAGRRVRYITPFRLYFIISALVLLLYTYGDVAGRIERAIASSAAQPHASAQQRAQQRYTTERVVRGFHTYWTNYGTILIVLLPLSAVLLKLRYWRLKKRFVTHLVFALHFQCILLLVTVPGALLHYLELNQWLHLSLLPLWTFCALRVVYGQGVLKTLFTTALLVLLPYVYQGYMMSRAIAAAFQAA